MSAVCFCRPKVALARTIISGAPLVPCELCEQQVLKIYAYEYPRYPTPQDLLLIVSLLVLFAFLG